MAIIESTFGLPNARLALLAFTDESNWNTGRFRAVAAVSLPVSEEGQLRERLKGVLRVESLSELKWERVGRAVEPPAQRTPCWGWLWTPLAAEA
jgi:hypothetical protein